MDYTFLVIGSVICIIVGYLVVHNISYISNLAIIIVLATTAATAISLTHSSGRMVIYNSVARSASSLSSDTVDKVCGEKNVSNTLCYKEIEYRGYPFGMVTIEYPPHSEAKVTLSDSRGRASGRFTNFMIYLLFFSLLAASIKKISLSRVPKNVH